MQGGAELVQENTSGNVLEVRGKKEITDHVEGDFLPKVRVNYNNVNAENGNGEADNILVRMEARNNSQKFLAKLGF